MSSVAPFPSPPPAASAEREIDVRYYAGLLWRARVLILTAAVLGLGLALLIGYLQVPEYQAAAMVQIDPPTPTSITVADALVGAGSYWQNTDFYNTQFKILRSQLLGDKVIDRLKLKDRPPFKDSPDPSRVFMAHVGIEHIPDSRLVWIQVTHQEPRDAALWANTLAEVYLEHSLASRVESAKKAYEWVQERLAATQQVMRESQDKLYKSYQSQDLFVPEGSVSAVTTSITKLNEDYIDAQARRIQLEAALKQVGDMRRKGQSLDSVPQVATDSQIATLDGQLAGQNLELSRLKEKYREAHPEVQRIQAQIDQVRKTKAARANQIVAGLQAEYSQLQKRETELRAAIDQQKAQAAKQSLKATELDALKKEADVAKSTYEILLQKLNETDIASSIRSNTVTLIEHAVPPTSPVRPVKRKIAAVGLLLGLALGVALVLGRDYLDNTIKDPDEVERYLHSDLLAAVPRYDETSVHLVTEAYQNLRTALIFGRKAESGQVVLITSTAPQEGKTTTLVNVAKLLASSGEKVVVLDFDLRRAQLHHRLGVTREPGITNYFVKHDDLDALIRPTRVPNLFVLTAGPLPPNPPALLARKDLQDFLDHLRRHFEWILLDSPPLASVTDALLLVRHADSAVVVVQHNKVDKKAVKRSVTALRKASPNVLGVVLNSVDLKSKSYYYYYYHEDRPEEAAGRKPAPRPVVAAKK